MNIDPGKLSLQDKKLLLAKKLSERKKEGNAVTDSQKALWYIYKSSPTSNAYNQHFASVIKGNLNLNAFKMAFEKIIYKHTELRARFEEKNGELYKYIDENSKDFIVEINVEKFSEQEIRRKVNKLVKLPFVLEEGKLFRVYLLLCNEPVLVIVTHHIVVDLWSMGIIIKDMDELYMGICKHKNIPERNCVTYSDYTVWQGMMLNSDKGEKQKNYWINKLKDYTQVIDIAKKKREAIGGYSGDMHNSLLAKDISRELREIARKENTTLFVILVSLYNILLYKYTSIDDIIIGSSVAGRNNPKYENTVGYFVNILPIRTRICSNETFVQYVSQVKKTVLEMLDNQEYPFSKILDSIDIPVQAGFSPLIQTAFSMETVIGTTAGTKDSALFSMGSNNSTKMQFADLVLESIDIEAQDTPYDLLLKAEASSDEINLSWQFNNSIIDVQDIKDMARHFSNMANSITYNCKMLIKDIEILDKKDYKLLFDDYNPPIEEYDGRMFLKEFSKICSRYPDSVAVTMGKESINYEKLDRISSKIAYFFNKCGITKEKAIGVCIDKSIEAIEILIGIFKSGNVYTPIDPEYPDERIGYIIEDSEMKFLIADDKEVKLATKSTEVIYLAELIEQSEKLSLIDYQEADINPNDAAYLIYTSGSTGKPKGVLVDHIGICNMTEGLNEKFGINNNSRVLQFASLSFDASIAEICTTLISGAQLVMAKKSCLYPGSGLETIIREHEITEVILTPSVLKLTNPEELMSLKTVMSAGENCSLSIIQKWSKYTKFINAYGPTESTVCATLTECNFTDSVIHIGKAIKNTRVYILDKDGNPVPAGMKGELCISSIGLARGYINNKRMTTERFIKNKIDKKSYERIYKSGDYASFMKDGNINFIGRIDNQVKIRGFRIELDEIEDCISRCNFINESAVIVKEDRNGLKRLVAFVSIQEQSEEKNTEILEDCRSYEKKIKEHIKNNLPYYMMPSNFVFLSNLPHSISKKIDKSKLKSIEISNQSNSQRDQMFTEFQLEIKNLWSDVLLVDIIDLEDNFLELGGHSLLLVQLIAKVRDKYNMNISVEDMYKSLVLKNMCELIESRLYVGLDKPNPIRQYNKVTDIPVTYAQKRLLFLEELGMGGSVYNISGSILVKGNLDIDILIEAFSILVNRHDILRTVFRKKENTYIQEILESVKSNIKVYKIEPDFTEEHLKEFIDKLNKKKFDLSTDLLIRCNLIFIGEQEYILNFAMHHSIGDGLSVMLITNEWSNLYKKLIVKENIQTEKNEFQYSDFAIWQQENIQGEVLDKLAEYWIGNLKGSENKYLPLETDYIRPSIQKYTGASVHCSISSNTYNTIKKISRQTNTTVYMVMLAAFNLLLYKHTGEIDINIGTPISGRSHNETQDMIGMFINTVIIRTKIEEKKDFSHLLAYVKKTVTGAMNHQDMPFEKLVEYLQPDRNVNRSPLFQVMFNMITIKEHKFELYKLNTEELENTSIDSKYDITLYVTENADQINLELSYNTSLFTEEHMTALLNQYRMVLSQIKIDTIVSEVSMMEKDKNQGNLNNLLCQRENNQSLLSMFSNCVLKMPDQEALNSNGLSLTYNELHIISNKLAQRLKEKCIGKGSCTGIYTDRCVAIPVAVMAVLKASSDFVIFDSTYPEERLLLYINELHIDAMLLCNANIDRSIIRELDRKGTSCIVYDREEVLYSQRNLASDCEHVFSLDKQKDIHYYTYTSGTTGRPQLIKSCISSVNHFIQWYIEKFSFDRGKRFGMLSGLSHDPLIRDIFTPLCSGGSLHIPQAEDMMMPDRMEQWMLDNRIELIHQTPSFIKMMKGKKFPLVKQICIGGEMLTNEIVRVLKDVMPQAEIVNCYGASETPQIMAYYVVDKDRDVHFKRVPIGKGIDGVEIYVMDSQMRETGLYESGEIWIRSAYMSKGYVNSKELTDKKFIKNPYTGESGDIIYKTGDMGYRKSNGEVICTGRNDNQIKIRGFRVEIGEIEQKICAFDEVKDARFILDKDSIIAYIVLKIGSTVSEREVNDRLKVSFPGYMIPSKYVFIDNIPVNANGKVDYGKLKNFHVHKKQDEDNRKPIASYSEIESTMLNIWKELLGREDINIYDNFFDVGGHSLMLAELYDRLKEKISVKFEMLALFQFPNINDFLENIIYKREKNERQIIFQKKKADAIKRSDLTDIAIIGMSGRFPMADNIEEYWDMIINGKEALTYLRDEELLAEGISEETINNPRYIKVAMLLNDYDKFDADFFDMTPREAEIMDPQQKIFMEECYRALENAGYYADNYDGKIGVFGGSSMNSFMIHNLIHNREFILENQELAHSFVHGNINDYLCTRVSYKLNLDGPAVAVQSACSTSMTAVHLACQSLCNYESNMVLAGGVTVKVPHKEGYHYVDGGIFSRDGHCRPFDDNCTGTIFGSGVGVVVLKRLEDAVRDGDDIAAVIKGTGINNDGNKKVGFTASSVDGEARAIKQALENAGVDIENIGYIEAHGTGTRMGDPIEIKALDNVYKEYTDKTSYCAIGSVKANIGHLNAASGIAGLIKAILVVKNGKIPPSINCDNPNSEIDFTQTPFYINYKLKNWESKNRRIAGVSSFGMGGTNVHVILENYCAKNGDTNG